MSDMGRDAMTDSREVMKRLSERPPQASDPIRHFGRDDSAGNNETCSRAPTDLRGSPEMLASLTGSIIPEL
jgi:hypothetical protein